MKSTQLISKIFLCLLGAATLNIAFQAIADPQTIMDNVQVTLGNITARNSVRALYGGVNLALGLFWLYAAFRMRREGLLLALLYTGGFAVGRIMSMVMDGQPEAFAKQWLVVESVFAIGSAVLLAFSAQKVQLAV